MLHCCLSFPLPFSTLLSHPFLFPHHLKDKQNETSKHVKLLACKGSRIYAIKTLSNGWRLSRCLCTLVNSSISEQLSSFSLPLNPVSLPFLLLPFLQLSSPLMPSLSASLFLIEFCQVHAAMPNQPSNLSF